MDGDRCYTLEEATALLPEIRRLVAVLQGEHAKGANGSRPPSPEEVLARLEELQVPLRDIRLGLVDFPTNATAGAVALLDDRRGRDRLLARDRRRRLEAQAPVRPRREGATA